MRIESDIDNERENQPAKSSRRYSGPLPKGFERSFDHVAYNPIEYIPFVKRIYLYTIFVKYEKDTVYMAEETHNFLIYLQYKIKERFFKIWFSF